MELNAFITVFHCFQEYNKKTVKIELKNCKSGLSKIKHFDKYVIFQIFNMCNISTSRSRGRTIETWFSRRPFGGCELAFQSKFRPEIKKTPKLDK